MFTIETLENSILPLCHGYEKPPKSIKETLGNAQIFEYRGSIWLLTCRHLIESVWRDSMVKSVKLEQSANYFLMWKEANNLRFHPSDTEQQTFNLALYYFGETDQFEPTRNFWNWDGDYSQEPLEEGDELLLLGIRSHQMSPESVVSSKPNPVTSIEGIHLDNTFNISPEDTDRTFMRQRAMRVPTKQLAEMAGGLVASKKENGWYPRGIVTGSGTVTIKMEKEAPPEEVGIYTYTDFKYLNQLLEPVKEQP